MEMDNPKIISAENLGLNVNDSRIIHRFNF